MTDRTSLAAKYLGLAMPSPIIVGSSGMTDSVEGVKVCAEAGAGAVVLKSLFEEQIAHEADQTMAASEDPHWHPEAAEYIQGYGAENAVGNYLRIIEGAKKAVDIPVIPSIHCSSSMSWSNFAKRAESAGADAIELNIFTSPTAPNFTAADNEKVYLDILAEVKKQVSVPVAIKLGPFFSSLHESLNRLSSKGADGLVLFNRFYQPDLDIENFKVVAGPALSTPEEIGLSLRTIAQLSNQSTCDLCGSTGIHDGADVVKMLLVGAKAVQVVSALYRHDIEYLAVMLEQVKTWMDAQGFENLARFQGRMQQDNWPEGTAYDRVQFMRRTVEGRVS